MKVAIVGSRSFDNYYHLASELDKRKHEITEIVSGGARGADALAKKYAELNGITYTEFPANWEKYGRSAGFRRNRDIVIYSDKTIAFWDGISKGTAHTITLTENLGKKVEIILV